MTITRGLGASALLAGLTLVLTAPVAGASTLDGHYIETETYPNGDHVDNDWYITSCGDGCASIENVGQASLVNGQWTLHGNGGVSCEDGGDVRDAISFKYTWDPDTLNGKVLITNKVAACGNPEGFKETNKLHLEPASPA